ncbi:MAG: hypothetical protein R6V33_00365 [Pelovirga sp.]
MLLLAKIIVTLVMILLLAAIAEYVNPKIAGILSGYPIGSAIVLYFYGLEYGLEFASLSALYNLAGLLPSLVFALAYLFLLRRRPDIPVIAATVIALLLYLGCAGLIGLAHLPPVATIILSAGGLLVSSYLVQSRSELATAPKLPFRLRVVAFRIIIAATLVITITALAGQIGSYWAGILSAFPLILMPLALIIHLHFGAACARSLLSHFPLGLWSVFCYSLTLSVVYPRFGLYAGTLIGFGAATIVLLLLNSGGLLRWAKRAA